MVLYLTETVYGLGASVLDEAEMMALFTLKGRALDKNVSWLVRDRDDIAQYAEISEVAEKLITEFLPGALTLVLPAKTTVPEYLLSEERTVGFRISKDPYAQALIAAFMKETNSPLSCTSANIASLPTLANPALIAEQFKAARPSFTGFERVIDGGERTGEPSTVVKVVGEEVTILRAGAVPTAEILKFM